MTLSKTQPSGPPFFPPAEPRRDTFRIRIVEESPQRPYCPSLSGQVGKAVDRAGDVAKFGDSQFPRP